MIIRNYPSCIFHDLVAPGQIPENKSIAEEIAKSVRDADSHNTDIHPNLLVSIPYYPICVELIGPASLRNDDIRRSILGDPLTAMTLLQAYYDATADEIEPVISKDGEVLYNLLLWARGKKIKLRNPYGVYEKAMAQDPFWAIIYARESKQPEIVNSALTFVESAYKEHPGAAYLYLAINDKVDPAPYAQILALDPLYACLASKKFILRGLRFKASQIRNVTPRWAFYLLTEGIFDDRKVFEDILLNDPGWSMEWLKQTGKIDDLPELKRYFQEMMNRAAKTAHPYTSPAQSYAERVIARMKATQKE